MYIVVILERSERDRKALLLVLRCGSSENGMNFTVQTKVGKIEFSDHLKINKQNAHIFIEHGCEEKLIVCSVILFQC